MRKTIITRSGNRIAVEALPTVSPYFIITPQLERVEPLTLSKTKYAVTHVKSGFSVLQDIRGKRKARLIAAIFAALPVSWDKITDWNSANKYFRAEMPAWVLDWRRAVSN